jgi:biopolymer transport protein ExbD
MAMSIGPGDEEERGVMSEINTTPLVDVMLVLLIIFLITIPVIAKTVPLTLPKATNIPTITKPENHTVFVDAKGAIYWDAAPLPDTRALIDRVKTVAVLVPQPEIHIRGDAQADFKDIGKVIYAIQRGGVIKVGFITDPDRGGAGHPQ